LCTIIIVHNTARQRQFSLYSPSSRPTSHLRWGQVEVRGSCPRRLQYALKSVYLSVCLSDPYPPLTRKRKNCTKFKLRREVSQVGSNGQSKFEVSRSKVKVTGAKVRVCVIHRSISFCIMTKIRTGGTCYRRGHIIVSKFYGNCMQ